jgi:hypothetical protein
MIYLYKTYVIPICDHVSSKFITIPACSYFSINLSRSHGQVLDGLLDGRLMLQLLF